MSVPSLDVAPLTGAQARRRELCIQICKALRHHPFKGSHRLRRLVSDVIVQIPGRPVTCDSLHDLSFHIDPAMLEFVSLERSLFYEGTYEEGTQFILQRLLRPGDVFLDAGANVGLMTLVGSRRVGNTGVVHSFEPNPDVLPTLRANVALNHASNVTIHAFGLGSTDEQKTLYPNRELSVGSASMIPIGNQVPTGEVTVTTLDTFVVEHGIDKIRLVKIDVEGWELELLKGARNVLGGEDPPILCVEYSEVFPIEGGPLYAIYEFIRDINAYEIYVISKDKHIPSPLKPAASKNDLPENDNIYCIPKGCPVDSALFA